MALWVLEARARRPLRLPDGPLHAVRAVQWVESGTDRDPVLLHTFLLEADAAIWVRPILEALIPAGRGVWDVTAGPAPDGTYLDTESRRALVVRDGVIVATRAD